MNNAKKSFKSLEGFLALTVIILALFPYTPKLLESSTQPWAAIAMLFLLFSYLARSIGKQKTSKSIIWLSIACIAVLSIQLVKLVWYPLDIKLIAVYFISIGFFWVGFSYSKVLSTAVLLWVASVWVFAGLIQVIYPQAFEFIVAGQELSYGRGQSSLAPEPSFFALHMGTLFLLAQTMPDKNVGNKQTYLLDLVLIFGLFLSGGGTSIVLGCLCLVIVFVKADIFSLKTAFSVLSVVAAVIASLALGVNFDRVNDLVDLYATAGISDGNVDASMATRMYHIGLSFQVFQEASVLGFSSLEFFRGNEDQFANMPSYLSVLGSIGDPDTNGKIHSLLARLLIDFGLIGFFSFIALIFILFRSIRKCDTLFFSLLSTGLIIILFFSSLPVGSGLFFITLGCVLSQTNLNEDRL